MIEKYDGRDGKGGGGNKDTELESGSGIRFEYM